MNPLVKNLRQAALTEIMSTEPASTPDEPEGSEEHAGLTIAHVGNVAFTLLRGLTHDPKVGGNNSIHVKRAHMLLMMVEAIRERYEPDIDESIVDESPLSTVKRDSLPDKEFAIPSKRKYPIHDLAHARNALARVSQFGTAQEKDEVKAAVQRRYPSINKKDESVVTEARMKNGAIVIALKDIDNQGCLPFGEKPPLEVLIPEGMRCTILSMRSPMLKVRGENGKEATSYMQNFKMTVTQDTTHQVADESK